jgi:adenylate cyclase
LSTSSKRTTSATFILIVASFLAIHLLFWLLPNVFEPWNAQTVDQLFSLRSKSDSFRPRYDSTIVHIDISDRTFELLENSYLNRFQYAEVVQNLADMGTALQLWDFILPAKMNLQEDSALVLATANARNAYFGLAFRIGDGRRSRFRASGTTANRYLEMTMWNVHAEGDPSHLHQAQGALITFPALAAASQGLGFLNLPFDRDGVYRRMPLLVRYREAYYPSLVLRAACDYLGVTPDRVVLEPGTSITLKGARRPGGQPRDIIIPIDRSANMLVNYVGPLAREDSVLSMLHANFADILRASDDRMELDIWRERLTGKIAVVSEVRTGAADVGPIPGDNDFPLSGVHSNAINTILTENFLRQADGLEMFLVELAVLVVLVLLALRLSSRIFSLGALGLIVLYFAVATLMFLFSNYMLNVLRPILEIGLGAFAVIAYRYVNEQKQKEVLRRSFEAYFPPTVVRKIMVNPSLVTAAGQKKELTILFSDIKSFTTYSSTLSPDEIQRLLNEYFEAMVEIVFKYEGTVDKFIGDGLMVFFGDPEPQPDHAVRCVKAAIEMQRKCRELKERWVREGKFPLMVRIGINTGSVVVGNMGSERRLSYTVLGADVNLAQRLEANAPVEGILITQRTYELVRDYVPTRALDPIKVKGLDEAVRVYEVTVEG